MGNATAAAAAASTIAVRPQSLSLALAPRRHHPPHHVQLALHHTALVVQLLAAGRAGGRGVYGGQRARWREGAGQVIKHRSIAASPGRRHARTTR